MRFKKNWLNTKKSKKVRGTKPSSTSPMSQLLWVACFHYSMKENNTTSEKLPICSVKKLPVLRAWHSIRFASSSTIWVSPQIMARSVRRIEKREDKPKEVKADRRKGNVYLLRNNIVFVPLQAFASKGFIAFSIFWYF